MSLTVIALVLLVVAAAIVYIIWKQAQNTRSSSSRERAATGKPAERADVAASRQGVGAKKPPRSSAGKRSAGRSHKHNQAPPLNPFRATSIKPGKQACEAVLAVKRKRYLVARDDIPSLPLAGCTSFNCNCKYVKHSDRRNAMEGDRRALGGLRRELMSQARDTERRRVRRGRRSDD